jgi:hypothetical protein
MRCVYCGCEVLQKVTHENDLTDKRVACYDCMAIQPDIAKTDQEIITHLVKGLQEIIELKNRTQYRDGLTQAFAGALMYSGNDIGKDGWVDLPEPMAKGFKKAASMAQNCLDTMPKKVV